MIDQMSFFDNSSDFYESDISKFSKTEAVFRVHASLIYKLGESLIADEVTALSELIKNSYDADAKFCSVAIDTTYSEKKDNYIINGKIEIIDNGCGMDLPSIVNGWLTLSNSPKKKMKKEKRTTPKYHRYPLGDKGLGRLSVQKLGRQMQLITKSEFSNIEYTVFIPWGDFLKNTTIDQIPVTINEKVIESSKSYTKIIIKDLINNDLWNNEAQINILSNSINKIVSPFRTTENNFKVIASVNNRQIEPIDTVFSELLSRARAKHIISYADGKSTLHSFYTSSFFYNRDMMDKILQNRFSVNVSSLSDFWNTCKSKLPNFEYQPNNKDVFTSNDFQTFEKIIYTNFNDNNTHDPGSFECEIYEYTLDEKFLKNFYNSISFSDIINQNEYREFIERFHGIKVVRDGFIVQGFGEGDSGDWLGLSSSSKTKGSFFDFRNDSVIGCVYLTGDNNSSLKETTNREGFVEDNYFLTFKQILVDSIKRINKNRKKLNDEMRAYLNQAINTTADVNESSLSFNPTINNVKERLEQTYTNTVENVQLMDDTLNKCLTLKEDISANSFLPIETVSDLEIIYSNILNLSTNYTDLKKTQEYLTQQIEAISFDFEKINERLQDLFELAGLGLSVEMFSHEFDTSIRNILLKNNRFINKSSFATEDFIKYCYYLDNALNTLRKQMSYFNPGLKFVRSEKQTFSFNEFIQEHRNFYLERCKSEEIEYFTQINNDFEVTVNRGMLNQVFDNLFNNSEYWLNFSFKNKIVEKKSFIIESKEKGIVTIYDNGIGISKDIENRLFDPFESKKDKGRGLGLYIVANNLKYHSSRIRLLGERNNHGNLFKFEIDLTASMS